MSTASDPVDVGFTNLRERMTHLCEQIHTVRHCDGVSPWNANRFAVAQKGRSNAEKIAASFVLLVWTQDPNHSSWSKLPAFDMTEAAARCDASVRQVMAEWLMSPFWP